jgi:ribosomal protein L7Ae-like RNA K-turn-binding protein
MEAELLGLLGIARRAGKLVTGFDAVVKSLDEGTAALVIVSGGASPRTIRNIKTACENRAELIFVGSGPEKLGHAVGRKKTAVAALTDKGFVKKAIWLSRK